MTRDQPDQEVGDAIHIRWLSADESRPCAGRYVLVSNNDTKEVGFARYKPMKAQWVFPSAVMAFAVTHFMYLPEAAE